MFVNQSLSNDPIHGYIPFTSSEGFPEGEASEREIVDHPWLQRLRQIHQLQTAWWVFPAAEHTRFQHSMGAMHLAWRVVNSLYDSLREVCPDTPSVGYIEVLMRMAALLHDVGHGPFGHFFDAHFLHDYGLTHETLGAEIIRRDLADLLRRVRRSPSHAMEPHETLDVEHVTTLITRPKSSADSAIPRWLAMLRSLFSGLYTVDNMDFVLRDAYMSGYSSRSFDLDRLLHYTRFSEKGLTIHDRGLSSLVRFIAVRAELFQAIYFHRTVRAIDLSLQELFEETKDRLFPGNPLDHLDEYRRFTEWSLLVRVSDWTRSSDPKEQACGRRWEALLQRKVRWKMACQRTIFFKPGESESANLFSNSRLFEEAIRGQLPKGIRDIPLKVDTARHVHRPGAHTPTANQNFLYDPATGEIRGLDDRELFRRIPISFRICRVYAETAEHNAELAAAMDRLLGADSPDDLTNM